MRLNSMHKLMKKNESIANNMVLFNFIINILMVAHTFLNEISCLHEFL
jgi:hypothetical protein